MLGFQFSARARARVLAGVAVASLLLAGACGKLAHDGKAAILSQQFEMLQNDPAMGPMFAELKADFPADYAALKDKLTQGLADTEPSQMSERARTLANEFMADFRRRLLPKAALASDEALGVVTGGYYQMLVSLQASNPEFCGLLAMGDGPMPKVQAAADQRAVANAMVLIFKAAKEGETSPVQRGPSSQADGVALAKTMQAQGVVTPDELRRMFGPGGMSGLSRPDQCRASVALFKAMDALPPPARARMMSGTLTSMAGQPMPS